MKVLLLNTYSMEKAFGDWKAGVTPSHHLWGKIELDQLGKIDMQILPHEKYPFLNKIGKFLHIEFLDQQIRTLLILRKIDIIYAPNGSGTTKLLTLLKWLGIIYTPIVVVAHQPQFFAPETSPLKRRLARLGMAQFDALVYLNKEMMKDNLKIYNIPNKHHKKYHTLDWGADTKFYEEFSAPTPFNETRFAISAGTTQRDIDTVIEAFRGIDFPLKVYTTPQLLPSVTDIPKNVTIYSEGITYKNLLQEYKMARVILVPMKISDTPNNTHGLTGLLDAMVMGKPIVITRNRYLIDVEEEGIGCWANRYDPGHWREVLNSFIFDEEKVSEMGYKAREIFHNKYNAEIFAKELQKIFLEVKEN